MREKQLFQRVLCQFAMGALIGPIFAAALFALRRDFFDVVLDSNAPATTLIILVLGVSSYFGFGAAITGFLFIMNEDSHSPSPIKSEKKKSSE